MDKYLLTEKDLYNIRLRGMDRFHERKGFGKLASEDVKLLLIIEGLELYLKGIGLELPFTVQIDPYKR